MSVESVTKLLGEYADQFTVSEKDGFVVAKPKNKIPKQDFSEIGKRVRNVKGEYVSYDYNTKTGGEFKFKIEKPEFKRPSTPQNKVSRQQMLDATEELLNHVDSYRSVLSQFLFYGKEETKK